MPARLVLTGVTGLHNRGVEALVRVTVDSLLSMRPDLQVTVLTHTPKYDAWRLGRDDVQFVANGFRATPNRPARVRQRIARRVPAIDGRWSAGAGAVADADFVVATGGDVFSSDYGRLRFHLAPLKYALATGSEVAFLAHSIGPFKTEAEGVAWSAVAERSCLVTLRESLSLNYLHDELRTRPSADETHSRSRVPIGTAGLRTRRPNSLELRYRARS